MHNPSHRPSRNSRSRRRFGRSPRMTGAQTSHHSHGRERHDRSRSGHGHGRGRVQPTFNPTQFINRNPITVAEVPEVYTPTHTFMTFGLNGRLTATVTSLNLTTPTPIQDQIIPLILKGHDVVGLAETGTGKTAAFLLPLIDKTLRDRNRQTLVLAPTRELAVQIEAELKKLARGLGLHSVVCVGGVNINPQIRGLRNRNNFIIGTPGRIIDLMDRKAFHPQYLTTVVLDEADRMLDMGFIGDMRTILAATPKERETLFFSATMPQSAAALVHDFLRDPVTVSVKKHDVTRSVKQDVVPYDHQTKFETLTRLLEDPAFSRVLVFGSMKHSVEKLGKALSRYGIPAESIHGNKNHNQRQRALEDFKHGRVRVLVATDVAARGIHVDDVTHVINYDLPTSFEDYVHRIGRTGRAHKRGIALTFVPNE